MPDVCIICHGATVRERGVHPERGAMQLIGCIACGRYFYSVPHAMAAIAGLSDRERYTLAAMTRRASDSGAPLELTHEGMRDTIAAAPRLTLSDRLDRLLLLLADRATNYFAEVPFVKEHDFPLMFANGPKGMNELLVAAMQLGYLDENPIVTKLTIKAWDRVDQVRATQPDSRQAFVAMWFDKALDPAWDQGLKVGIERSKYFRALRVDAVQHNEKIDDRIVMEIRRSGLVVADFTGQRPGVYYEAGLARGLGLTVISTCRKDETDNLHFDTRQYNHIVWTTPADLADQLHERISATALPKGWGAPGQS